MNDVSNPIKCLPWTLDRPSSHFNPTKKLARMNPAQARKWVQSTLLQQPSGKDETNYGDILIHMIKDPRLGSKAQSILSDAIVYTLRKAKKERKLDGAQLLKAILRVCQQAYVPDTAAWFQTEIERLVRYPIATRNFWGGDENMRQILYAAVIQCPAWIRHSTKETWTRLLHKSTYSTFGYLGLCHSFDEYVQLMREWWSYCDTNDRVMELEEILFTSLKRLGKAGLRRALGKVDAWPIALALEQERIIASL